ncbi:BTAD domain-containing putative transcriptional regulator, partial [Actinoplanes sp. NPDC051633]|uniref:BTAD domain-containing putative transcriptional regulator n=1 Tax=Actinoplanes sp. NPDC051633 TaxID=3155670 RepID=UPI0034185B8A
MDFQVLGPLRVVVDGAEVPIATRRQRALLVLLAMSPGRAVPTERLIDQLWDGAPPPQGAVTLRSYVSNVRQALGGPAGGGSRLVTRGQGYCLDVPAETVDAVRLSTGAQQGRERLRQHRPRAALAAFDEAIGTWRGDPLADIADHDAARSTIAQLTETYLGAVEGRFEALLELGRHADALPGLERFAADHPLREEPRALLMLALYRSGRAADALEVHRSFRELLNNELGIDPSARLDDLYRRVLSQDLAVPRAPVVTGDAPDIVGRGRELSLIEARLDALAGEGSLLLIAGEPGIGKTTLLEALEQRAAHRGIPVHAGRSPAATGAPPFWPWVQVIESLAAGLDDDALRRACAGAARPVALLSATVAERTGQPVPIVGDDPQAQRFQLYDAVSVFVRQAVRGPAVIMLDDIHWADAPSLELMSYLTPSLASRPILVVAAYRDLPNERTEALDAALATVFREDVTHEMSLGGLGPDGVADLLAGLASSSTVELATVLHERTGGNPFFVRQLARYLADDASGSLETLPRGVLHVVARRLAALPGTAR